MTKQLQKQLNQQRHLLHLELPSSNTNNSKQIRYLDTNGKYSSCDDEIDTLNNGSYELGALPSPASELANVAVKLFFFCLLKKFIEIYVFLLSKNVFY